MLYLLALPGKIPARPKERSTHPNPNPNLKPNPNPNPGKIPAPPKEGSAGWVTPAVLSLWALFGK